MKNRFKDWLLLSVIVSFSSVSLFVCAFFLYAKIERVTPLSQYLPADTQLYLETELPIQVFGGYISELAVPFEYSAMARVSSGALYVLDERDFESYLQSGVAQDQWYVTPLDADARVLLSSFEYDLPNSEVLHDTVRFQRIYQQMNKFSPLRAYVDLGLLISELIHTEDETTHLFKEFVFSEFLDDLGVVGIRMDEKRGAFEFQILNAYNASIEEMPEDSLLYEVELAAFIPPKDGIWFFDGFGFAKKFDLAMDRAKEKAVLVENLVTIYLKDLFEQIGINAMDLIEVLEGEYAVYYDQETGYRQLAFEIVDVAKLDQVNALLVDAFDAMHKTYPPTETTIRNVTLQDGTTGQWEIAAHGSLVSQKEYTLGSIAIQSIEYDGESVLAFAQVDEVFLIGTNADTLRENISAMLRGESLAESDSYNEMKEYFPFSGSDFLYVSGISFMGKENLLIGKHVFADNMFLKAVIK